MAMMITDIDGLKFDPSAFGGTVGTGAGINDSSQSSTTTWSSQKIASQIASVLGTGGTSSISVSDTIPYSGTAGSAVVYAGATSGGLICGRIYRYVGGDSVKEDGHMYALSSSSGATTLYSSKAYPSISVGDTLLTYAGGKYTSTTTVASLLTGSVKFGITTASGLTLFSADPAWEMMTPYVIGAGLADNDGTLSVAVGSGVSVDSTTNKVVVDTTTEEFTNTVTEVVKETQTASTDDIASLLD